MALCGERLYLGEQVNLVINDIERISGGTWGWLEGYATLPVLSASSCSWRFTFYLIAFIAGMAVIVDVSGD